jgi:hypothetical protein
MCAVNYRFERWEPYIKKLKPIKYVTVDNFKFYNAENIKYMTEDKVLEKIKNREVITRKENY